MCHTSFQRQFRYFSEKNPINFSNTVGMTQTWELLVCYNMIRSMTKQTIIHVHALKTHPPKSDQRLRLALLGNQWPSLLRADSEDSDQTVQMHKLGAQVILLYCYAPAQLWPSSVEEHDDSSSRRKVCFCTSNFQGCCRCDNIVARGSWDRLWYSEKSEINGWFRLIF